MSEKVLGYLLIAIGIIAIIYSFFDVYNVFTGKKREIILFDLPGISINLPNMLSEGELGEEQKLILKSQGKSLNQEIIQKELINKPLNIIAHLLFMGFLANIGYKIASLGVQLVRPIKVNLRESHQLNPGVGGNSSSQSEG